MLILNHTRQKGIVLYIALVLMLLLSVVVYSSLYRAQRSEMNVEKTAINANRTRQAADAIVFMIENSLVKNTGTFVHPSTACTDAECNSIPQNVLTSVNDANLQGFTPFGQSIGGVNEHFYHIQNLGVSDKIPAHKDTNFNLYRITVVSVFSDTRSAIESLIAIPE